MTRWLLLLLAGACSACSACSMGPDDPSRAGSREPAEDSAAPAQAEAPIARVVDAHCASPAVEQWSGTAGRDNQSGYPDHIEATVTWRRISTADCIDQYAPTGMATYAHAIPGALCRQSIHPETHAISEPDGVLYLDRSRAPATYSGEGATYWGVVFRCEYDDGNHEEHQLEGGAVWFDGAGAVEESDGGETMIAGSYRVEDDAERCGPSGIAPCAYRWAFFAD